MTSRCSSYYASVIGQLAPDGAVELVQLDIDRDATWWRDERE